MPKKRVSFGPGTFANRRSPSPRYRLMPKLRQLIRSGPQLAYEFYNSSNLVVLLIAIEAIVNYLVINYVKYTEIDWSTYMAQVSQVLNRTSPNFDYSQIEGPTGPLVYPAGHLLVFSFLKLLTDSGTDIKFAQFIFSCIYLAQIFLVYQVYSHKRSSQKVPPYMFIIMCLTSYRIHSIYVLRLFNDPIAVLLAYASFVALLHKRHSLSAFLFSFAIATKMNILLFAPAYALIYYEDQGLAKSIKYASIALATQLTLAIPFLYSNPSGYIERAFNFGRVFEHKWTVNWRFLSEKTFASPEFFKLLLLLHIAVLIAMFFKRWLNTILPKRFLLSVRREDPILTLFIANFIGVAFSRSLHYQFYVWYYHSLPMLLWATRFKVVYKLLIFGCIEWAWNQYPSTEFSSILLHVCHFAILIGLFTRYMFRPTSDVASSKSTVKKRR